MIMLLYDVVLLKLNENKFVLSEHFFNNLLTRIYFDKNMKIKQCWYKNKIKKHLNLFVTLFYTNVISLYACNAFYFKSQSYSYKHTIFPDRRLE